MAKTLQIASLIVLFMIASAARPALAQVDEPRLAPPAQPAPEPRVALQTTPRLDAAEPALKSPAAALWLSLGSTAVPLAASFLMLFYGGGDGREALQNTGFIVGGLGMAVGPSVGLLYAGDTRRAVGMGLGRMGLMVGGIALSLAAINVDDDSLERKGLTQTFCLLAGISAGITALALAIWDIAAAPGAARRTNARLRQRISGLNLGPLVTDAGAGKRGYGLALGGRF